MISIMGNSRELSDEMEECIPSGADPDSNVDTIVLTDAVNSFLKSLNSEQRTLFIRRYWYFDSVTELSSRYGWTQSKVKTTLFRLRERLRDHLKKEGFEL